MSFCSLSTKFLQENCYFSPKKLSDYSDCETDDSSSQISSKKNSKQKEKEHCINYTDICNEIDVKPKPKLFPTSEDRIKFVTDYQKKWKTELCKNYLLKGSCPYGDQCCFAHGKHELIRKTEFTSAYKTRPCKKYFLNGYCPYGYRCQYLHHDIQNTPQFYNFLINLYKSKQIILDTRLPNLYQNKLKYLQETESNKLNSRLNIFLQLQNNDK